MPRLNGKPPKLRHHKGTNRHYVVFPGCSPFYLGRHGSTEASQRYHALIVEWLDNGRQPPAAVLKKGMATQGRPTGAELARAATPASPAHPRQDDLRVKDVVLAFLRHAMKHYRRADGQPTGEVESFRQLGRLLVSLNGDEPAAEFGPLKLRRCREWMIRGGWVYRDPADEHRQKQARPWCRTTINRQVRRIRTLFKWAASMELVPPTVPAGLATVPGLRHGRTDAAESEPVKPVDEGHVEATLEHMPPPVAAMVRLQLLTGMRPGEVVAMRGRDLDTSGKVWIYRPEQHKNRHRGHGRAVMIGPKAQAVLRPWLKAYLAAHLFSPAEAEAARRAALTEARTTPMSCGNKPGSNRRRKPHRSPGESYSVASYARAIRRACELTYPPPEEAGKEEAKAWNARHRYSPHQLRHTAGTRFRKAHGLDAAQVLLGHRHAAVTEVYAEADVEKAAKTARRIG